MKKIVIFAAILCLFSISVFSQEKSNFSGNWILDKSKSKLSEHQPIESMKIKATRTATDLNVETELKNAGANPSNENTVRLSNTGAVVYKLDGSETIMEVDSPMGKVPVSRKAEFNSNKIKTLTIRTINTPNGQVNITTAETWELLEDGKVLKIIRTIPVRGVDTVIEMVFNKEA